MRESITYVMDLVDEYTAPAAKIINKAGQMDGEFKDLNDELKKASTIKADLNHFGALSNKLDANSEALKEARLNSAKLGREIANTTTPTARQTRAFEQSRATVNRLRRSQTEYRTDLHSLSGQLRTAGVNTARYATEQRLADAAITRTTRSLDAQLVTMTTQARRMAQLQGNVDRWSSRAERSRNAVGAGDVVAAGGAIYAVKKLADAYGEVASAQGELQSLGMVTADIDKVTDKARAFSSEYAGFSQSELIKSTYDLKSGISSLGGDALAGFLEISAKVAGGTKANIDTVTGLMATGYGVYRKGFDKFGAGVVQGWDKLSADEKDLKFGEYFGAGIASAVQQFKTDGGQMTDAIKSLGTTAESSNVPLAEQLAILGSLQTTMSGSEAATKYKSFMQNAVKASGKLGLSFTDSNNQLLSSADIIDRVRGKYGNTLDDIEKADLKKAFGSKEAMSFVTDFYDKTTQLRESVKSISGAMDEGDSSYTKMANAIMKGGPAESMELLGQINKNLMADMGAGFAPIIAEMATVVGGLSVKIGTFLRDNKDLASYIAIGTTALIALKVALVAGQFAFGGIATVISLGNKALLFWRTATLGAAAGTSIMSQAGMVFNAIWAANPIGLIITGVVALGAAMYAVYKYWDDIKDFFGFGNKDISSTVDINKTENLNQKVGYDKYNTQARKTQGTPNPNLQNEQVKSGRGFNKYGQQPTANTTAPNPQLKADQQVKAGVNGGKTLISNDTYQFNVPESNDPLVVKAAIKNALAERDREKELKMGGLMYD